MKLEFRGKTGNLNPGRCSPVGREAWCGSRKFVDVSLRMWIGSGLAAGVRTLVRVFLVGAAVLVAVEIDDHDPVRVAVDGGQGGRCLGEVAGIVPRIAGGVAAAAAAGSGPAGDAARTAEADRVPRHEPQSGHRGLGWHLHPGHIQAPQRSRGRRQA
jgi:hypothetical protein